MVKEPDEEGNHEHVNIVETMTMPMTTTRMMTRRKRVVIVVVVVDTLQPGTERSCITRIGVWAAAAANPLCLVMVGHSLPTPLKTKCSSWRHKDFAASLTIDADMDVPANRGTATT